MTIIYTAIDGKSFSTPEACEAYERGLKRKEIFRVFNRTNENECFIVKQGNEGALYIEKWEYDCCTFNSTLKNFLIYQFH